MAGLPADSLCVEITNPGASTWSVTNELLAALIEVVDAVSIRESQTAVGLAPGRRKWKPPKPIEVPRPWIVNRPKRRRKATPDDLKAKFGDRLRGGG